MTREADINALNEVVQLVLEEGMDGLGAAVSILLNEAMKIERSRALRARPGSAPRNAGGTPTDTRIRRVSSFGPGARATQRTGLETGVGANVRAGRVDS